jgi:MFS family permease
VEAAAHAAQSRPPALIVPAPSIGGAALGRLLIVGLGTLVAPLDSMVNVAFPALIGHFGVPIAAIQWVVIPYVLAQSSLLLVFGRLGDLLGYRRIFLLGAAWSAAAFICCALAPGFGWLVAARVLQGVGAGLLLSCGPALATQLFAAPLRPRVLGLYTMMFALGGALGPALAGPLVGSWGWEAVFAARAPLALLAFACAWALPADVPARAPLDASGAALLAAGIAGLVLALALLRGGLAAPLVLGGGGAACLLWYWRRPAGAAIIEPALFRLPGFGFINLASIGLNFAGFAVLLLVPFYLARFTGLPAPIAGLLLALSPLGVALGAPLAGALAGRVAPRRLVLAGTLASAAGLGLLGFAGAAPSLALLSVAMLVQGIGLGVFQLAYLDVITATLPPAARGVAGSLAMLTRTIGLVAGASLLIAAFEALRDGHPGADGFLAGFHGAVLLAAVVALALLPWMGRLAPRR